jgi:hypothetical protein
MQHVDAADASQHEAGDGAEKRMPKGMHSPQKLAAAFQRGRRKWRLLPWKAPQSKAPASVSLILHEGFQST